MLWLVPSLSHADPSPVPEAYLRALSTSGVPESSAAVVIRPLDGAGLSLAIDDGRPMNPASTMKLVTTFAALQLLGPDYRWRTDVLTEAPLTGRALAGDLILRGTGDPSLVIERFWLLVHRLRALGIDTIGGDLVLDRQRFVQAAHDPGEFDGAPERPYNVAPDALLVNFKSVALTFIPDPAANHVRIVATPALAGLRVPASVPLLEGSCGDWRSKLRSDLAAPLAPAFRGGYPATCGERSWHLSVLSHADYLEALFRGVWHESGGSWDGRARDGIVPASARLLVSLESPPLAQLIRDVNKFSNNVMTRQLFLTLGAEFAGHGSEAAARQAIVDWLASRGFVDEDFVIDNGSGLSRSARIRPAMLADLLVDAWRDPRMPEFVASLPITGVDGTAAARPAARGAAHLKTGLLRDVRAIAGYVHAASGRRYVVVALINHPNAPAAQSAHDALIDWLHLNG